MELILKFAVLDAGGNIYKSNIIEDEKELYDPHYYVIYIVFVNVILQHI